MTASPVQSAAPGPGAVFADGAPRGGLFEVAVGRLGEAHSGVEGEPEAYGLEIGGGLGEAFTCLVQ